MSSPHSPSWPPPSQPPHAISPSPCRAARASWPSVDQRGHHHRILKGTR
jgi:hypothetical protein